MAQQDHKSWIVSAGWQRLGDSEVVTGRYRPRGLCASVSLCG
jgi:hypothetical protein